MSNAPLPARPVRLLALVSASRELLDRVAPSFLNEASGLESLVRVATIDTETPPSATRADGVFLLLRYLDGWSIKATKELLEKIPSTGMSCTHVLLCRPEGEIEFKMSCPACGQKLWVRDLDAGRAGRCPQCKRSFTLPDPESHIRNALAMEQQVAVSQLPIGDTGAARAALKAMMDAIAQEQARRHGTTTRVQVANDTKKGDQPTPTP